MDLFSLEREFHRVSKISIGDLKPYHSFRDIARSSLSSWNVRIIVYAFIHKRLRCYFNWIQSFDYNDSFVTLCGNTGEHYFEHFVFPFNTILDQLIESDYPFLRAEALLAKFLQNQEVPDLVSIFDATFLSNK